MNCPNCGSEMIQVFSKWVCEDCHTGNQTYYTSKTLTPSLLSFLNFPKMINSDTDNFTLTIPSHGTHYDIALIITLRHHINTLSHIKFDIKCDNNYAGWKWTWKVMNYGDHINFPEIKLFIYDKHNCIPNDTRFKIKMKYITGYIRTRNRLGGLCRLKGK